MSPRSSIVHAFAVSFVLHAALLSLDFHTPPLRVYPAPLVVLLVRASVPDRSEDVSPLDDAIPQAHSISSETDSVVELTKRNESPRSIRQQPDRYFHSHELSVRPKLLNPESLEDATGQFPAQVSGEVTLTAKISREGTVVVTDVEPTGSEFADWLITEFPKVAKFSPAEREGMPVNSQVRLRFSLLPASR